jgi:hypothetical protein
VTTFVTDVVDWLLSGSGTALCVGTDVGTRGLDFLDGFGITGCTGFNCFNNDTVIPVMPMHPTMINSTQASLSNWSQSTHNRIINVPAGWDVVAEGPAAQIVVICSPNVMPPTCTFTAPAGPVMDDVITTLDVASPNGPTFDLVVEFSTDGGATYQGATPAASSPTVPPVPGLPVGMHDFHWDSRGDGVGLALVQPAELRASIDDGVATSECSTALFDVDNTMLCNGICGDCDLNAAGPDILDALAAAQIAAGLLVPSPLQVACCDVNSSASVEILDALFIAQGAAGLSVTLVCL